MLPVLSAPHRGIISSTCTLLVKNVGWKELQRNTSAQRSVLGFIERTPIAAYFFDSSIMTERFDKASPSGRQLCNAMKKLRSGLILTHYKRAPLIVTPHLLVRCGYPSIREAFGCSMLKSAPNAHMFARERFEHAPFYYELGAPSN